jgi:hypothetical protein
MVEPWMSIEFSYGFRIIHGYPLNAWTTWMFSDTEHPSVLIQAKIIFIGTYLCKISEFFLNELSQNVILLSLLAQISTLK